ncbi:DedA family protein [Rhodococcus sp. IEGM 1408]|uniref:DedA family protein n=1 Tax=Rhodococcus sp. IEGM 1408 TaxID=3082220 RepID=UPI0029544481|nr:VTT domain-containing protein [Rhodococcus sp. IEGM 1408]MDV8002337.1 VTT domain-containing protein [Rhodococcus sp. IEGM 1408]
MDRIAEQPFGVAFATLFVIVMLRANATYWLGRGALRGGMLSRKAARHLEGSHMQRAQRLSARYGVIAVPLSFLTIGIQTAVNVSAGFTRMPLRRYLPAVAVECVMWAFLYSTVGMVGWAAIATLWSEMTS